MPPKTRASAAGSSAEGPSSGGVEPEADSKDAAGEDRKYLYRLTEQEKKRNHIASEKKRRAAIREGFDRLTELVPGLNGMGKSEAVVLHTTVGHIKELLAEQKKLVAEIESLGQEVPAELREPQDAKELTDDET